MNMTSGLTEEDLGSDGGEIGGESTHTVMPRPTNGEDGQEHQGSPRCDPTREKANANREGPGKRFACPYYKHNPKKFKGWRTCVGPGFTTIHRLKEHLNRKHTSSRHTCNRCFLSCKTASNLLEHQRSAKACLVKPDGQADGQMTAAQQLKLRSKKRVNSSVTDEDKWTTIYYILFPEGNPAAIPSPYYVDEEELLNTSQSPKTSSPGDFSQQAYEDFLKVAPPPDLEQDVKDEIRRVLGSSEDGSDRVDKIFDVALRLPIMLLKRYELLSRFEETEDGNRSGEPEVVVEANS